MNNVKVFVLMAGLTALVVAIGQSLGGGTGASIALLPGHLALFDDEQLLYRAGRGIQQGLAFAVISQFQLPSQPSEMFARHAVERHETCKVIGGGKQQGIGIGHSARGEWQ